MSKSLKYAFLGILIMGPIFLFATDRYQVAQMDELRYATNVVMDASFDNDSDVLYDYLHPDDIEATNMSREDFKLFMDELIAPRIMSSAYEKIHIPSDCWMNQCFGQRMIVGPKGQITSFTLSVYPVGFGGKPRIRLLDLLDSAWRVESEIKYDITNWATLDHYRSGLEGLYADHAYLQSLNIDMIPVYDGRNGKTTLVHSLDSLGRYYEFKFMEKSNSVAVNMEL